MSDLNLRIENPSYDTWLLRKGDELKVHPSAQAALSRFLDELNAVKRTSCQTCVRIGLTSLCALGFFLLFAFLIGLVLWLIAIPFIFLTLYTEAAVRRKFARIVDKYRAELGPFYLLFENFTKGGCCASISYSIFLKATFDALPVEQHPTKAVLPPIFIKDQNEVLVVTDARVLSTGAGAPAHNCEAVTGHTPSTNQSVPVFSPAQPHTFSAFHNTTRGTPEFHEPRHFNMVTDKKLSSISRLPPISINYSALTPHSNPVHAASGANIEPTLSNFYPTLVTQPTPSKVDVTGASNSQSILQRTPPLGRFSSVDLGKPGRANDATSAQMGASLSQVFSTANLETGPSKVKSSIQLGPVPELEAVALPPPPMLLAAPSQVRAAEAPIQAEPAPSNATEPEVNDPELSPEPEKRPEEMADECFQNLPENDKSPSLKGVDGLATQSTTQTPRQNSTSRSLPPSKVGRGKKVGKFYSMVNAPTGGNGT